MDTLYFYIAFDLQEKCYACCKIPEEVEFEEKMTKWSAKNHGVAEDVFKETKIYIFKNERADTVKNRALAITSLDFSVKILCDHIFV